MASVEVDPAIALPDEVPQEEDHNEVGQVLVEVEVLCPKVKDQDDGLLKRPQADSHTIKYSKNRPILGCI